MMLLQRKQQATRFSQLSCPPRERGMTWSMVEAEDPRIMVADMSTISNSQMIKTKPLPINPKIDAAL